MWPQHKSTKYDPIDLRRFCFGVGSFALYLISSNADYDPYNGWRFFDRPYCFNLNHVTKEQALSMIREQKINIYGARNGQIVMKSDCGKWFALNYYDNQDLIRELGRYAHYVCYEDGLF